jgi:hypothetical protein
VSVTRAIVVLGTATLPSSLSAAVAAHAFYHAASFAAFCLHP